MKLVKYMAVAVALLAAPAAALAQTGTLAGDLRADWEGQAEQIIGIADAMPAANWDYRPTEPQQTFGERVLHVAQVNMMLLGMLGSSVPAPAINMDVTSKDDVMQALRQSFDYGAQVVASFNQAQLLEAVDARFLGQSTRARIIAFSFAHNQDIYGQLAVYLRLNEIVPPASRRPGV